MKKPTKRQQKHAEIKRSIAARHSNRRFNEKRGRERLELLERRRAKHALSGEQRKLAKQEGYAGVMVGKFMLGV